MYKVNKFCKLLFDWRLWVVALAKVSRLFSSELNHLSSWGEKDCWAWFWDGPIKFCWKWLGWKGGFEAIFKNAWKLWWTNFMLALFWFHAKFRWFLQPGLYVGEKGSFLTLLKALRGSIEYGHWLTTRIVTFITHWSRSLVHVVGWENVVKSINHCVNFSFQSQRWSYRVCARSWINWFFVRTFPLRQFFG